MTTEIKTNKIKKTHKKSTTFIQDLENKSGKPWYEQVPRFKFDSIAVELNQDDLVKLNKEAKQCLELEITKRKIKPNSEQGWLQTALNKGTARDRANAGAVLVESDPIRNIHALNALVALCKAANKECLEVIDTLTELFLNCLLPSDRKLIPLSGRGAAYKELNNNININIGTRKKILAFWQFEAELKEVFISFVRNIQASAGIGLEVTKCRVVSCASRILNGTPEQEQTLLSLLVNKLGDPSHKVASKSIYHLSSISHTHPNMCGVIVRDAEKFLFRNNLPKKAQHYALCFLGNIGGNVQSDVAERLVRICFAFFKASVNKGEVETRTMSTILSCVRKAIPQVEKKENDSPVLTEDLQSTMYRLIHAANIKVSLQALGLIIQVEQGSNIYSDRFYTALYKRIVDPALGTVSPTTMAMGLHIIYKAISLDPQPVRARAFIKRFLQVSLYFPVSFMCASLFVISKILISRKDEPVKPNRFVKEISKITAGIVLNESDLPQDDTWLLEDTGEEKYEDVLLQDEDALQKLIKPQTSIGSWYHANKITNEEVIVKLEDDVDAKCTPDVKKRINDKMSTSYDAYHRNPSFAGGEFTLNHEVIKFREHFHPTVQLFADKILDGKPIEYSGDPLQDFSAAKFLERFSFKNPKQIENINKNTAYKKYHYISEGSRSKTVYNLNENNVTEEERYIFQYLQRRREKHSKPDEDYDSDAESDTSSIGDNEFDAYLDKLAGRPKDDEEFDFMEEVGDKLKSGNKSNKHSDSDSDSELEADETEDMEGNELSGDDNDDEEMVKAAGEEDNFSDLDSLDDDLTGDLDDDAEDIVFSDDDDVIEEVGTKSKRGQKRKGENLESLFADADDFAHLLDEAGASKQKLGSSSAVFNRDKSSEKQLKWEEKRRPTFKGKKFKKR